MSDLPTPSLSNDELQRLRDLVVDLWSCGMDTQEIAQEIGYAEAWVDREISKHLDRQLTAGISTERSA